jgi:hypothetical protein
VSRTAEPVDFSSAHLTLITSNDRKHSAFEVLTFGTIVETFNQQR